MFDRDFNVRSTEQVDSRLHTWLGTGKLSVGKTKKGIMPDRHEGFVLRRKSGRNQVRQHWTWLQFFDFTRVMEYLKMLFQAIPKFKIKKIIYRYTRVVRSGTTVHIVIQVSQQSRQSQKSKAGIFWQPGYKQ